MEITVKEISLILVIALIPAILALKLGRELYK